MLLKIHLNMRMIEMKKSLKNVTQKFIKIQILC